MKKSGFTLIEIMVAVSIFAIVAIIATGAFITANKINQKAQAIKLVMDNLNFAVDSITFHLRNGGEYYCADDINPSTLPEGTVGNCTGGNSLSMIDAETTERYVYRFDESAGTLEVWSNSNSEFTLMTLPELKVLSMDFSVSNTGTGAQRVWIQIYGKAVVSHEEQTFALETLVSERK